MKRTITMAGVLALWLSALPLAMAASEQVLIDKQIATQRFVINPR